MHGSRDSDRVRRQQHAIHSTSTSAGRQAYPQADCLHGQCALGLAMSAWLSILWSTGVPKPGRPSPAAGRTTCEAGLVGTVCNALGKGEVFLTDERRIILDNSWVQVYAY